MQKEDQEYAETRSTSGLDSRPATMLGVDPVRTVKSQDVMCLIGSPCTRDRWTNLKSRQERRRLKLMINPMTPNATPDIRSHDAHCSDEPVGAPQISGPFRPSAAPRPA